MRYGPGICRAAPVASWAAPKGRIEYAPELVTLLARIPSTTPSDDAAISNVTRLSRQYTLDRKSSRRLCVHFTGRWSWRASDATTSSSG